MAFQHYWYDIDDTKQAVGIIIIENKLFQIQWCSKIGRMQVMSYSARKQIVAAIVLVYVGWVYVDGFQLTVLHTNDIHSRIEQTNKYLGVCKKKDVGMFNCNTR